MTIVLINCAELKITLLSKGYFYGNLLELYTLRGVSRKDQCCVRKKDFQKQDSCTNDLSFAIVTEKTLHCLFKNLIHRDQQRTKIKNDYMQCRSYCEI